MRVMRFSPEFYQKAMERQNKLQKKLCELEPRVGILNAGLNPILTKRIEELEEKIKRNPEKIQEFIEEFSAHNSLPEELNQGLQELENQKYQWERMALRGIYGNDFL
jgi:chromosome segregation ATPase